MEKHSLVTDLISKGRIFDLVPEFFMGRPMERKEMIAIFNFFGAFWEYDGIPRPEKPHALLKSGLHSNGFISCKEILQYPHLCDLFANEIVKILNAKEAEKIDVVVSSAYSAITLGFSVASLLRFEHNEKIEYIPVEKDEKGNPTIIRGGVDSSKRVLVINELMTTGSGSTWETKKAVLECNGENPPPTIIEPSFVLVHRSKDYELPDGSKVQPVFHFDIENFEPSACPYCQAGSEAIKPKIGNNWNILHGRV
jgi:orotate phosphoribosyltransferase